MSAPAASSPSHLSRRTGVRARTFLPALLATGAVLLVGCGGDDGGESAASTSGGSGDGGGGRSEMIQQVSRSLAAITSLPRGEKRAPDAGAPHSHGSGVLYGDTGLVLTSNHFVENAGSLSVIVNGKTYQGRAVARAQCNDMALLKLRPTPAGAKGVTFADSAKLQPGQDVTAIGYLRPPGSPAPQLISTAGTVSAIDVPGEITPLLPDVQSLVLHQAPLKPAMSGGALVDDQGRFVGLTTYLDDKKGSAPDTYAAIASNRVKSLLGELKPTSGALYSGWQDQHKCHAAMAKLTGADYKAHAGH